MSFATITGVLTDSDTTPWVNAVWVAVAVSPSSPPVFADGSPVLATFGQLDNAATFSGSLPRTDSILPTGTTLTITVYSVTSAPPSVITNVEITTPTVDLGSFLSPLITAPRIQAGELVYAYQDFEILNPTHGSGYVNTTQKLAYMFVGDTWVPIDSGPLDQIYPPSGVAVSTGTAWSASIPPATIAFLNTANNFSQLQTLEALTVTGDTPVNTAISNITARIGGGTPVFSLINNMAPVNNRYWDVVAFTASNLQFRVADDTAGNSAAWMQVFRTGSTVTGINMLAALTQIEGDLTADTMRVTGSITPNTATSNVTLQVGAANPLISMSCAPAEPNGKYWDFVATPGLLVFRLGDDNGSSLVPWMQVFRSGNTLTGVSILTTLFVQGEINASGTKNFRIPHPLDHTKQLTHACIEGPEAAVFYRGEGETKGGDVVVTLPDYFEALTRREGRTIQLTAIEDGSSDPGVLTATRIRDGQFTVSSSNPDQEFWWEVKAVRADVPTLEVVT